MSLFKSGLGPEVGNTACCGGSPQATCDGPPNLSNLTAFTPYQKNQMLMKSMAMKSKIPMSMAGATGLKYNPQGRMTGDKYYMPKDAVGVL